jgi:curved DNA-binding protein CbpA
LENYYEILGISPDADDRTIKKAYHTLVKECHPDSPRSKELPEANEKFRLTREAYETLINKDSRKTYDKYVLKKHSILSKAKKESYIDKAVEHYEYGREAFKAKKFHSAGRAFQTALNLNPDNALYYSWLGLTLSYMHGKLHDAKKWCEKAIELSPYNADYHINLAIIYKDAGLMSMAERYLKEALKLDPDNQRARLWLADKDNGHSFKELLKSMFGWRRKK